MKRFITTLLAAAALLSGGCSDSLDPASLLNKTRPLGVHFSVQGDPDRSEPAVGETVDITILLGHEFDIAAHIEIGNVGFQAAAEAKRRNARHRAAIDVDLPVAHHDLVTR